MYPAWNKIADSIAMPVKIIPLLRIMLPEKKRMFERDITTSRLIGFMTEHSLLPKNNEGFFEVFGVARLKSVSGQI